MIREDEDATRNLEATRRLEVDATRDTVVVAVEPERQPEPGLPAGVPLGHFVIERQIGSGGMGHVYAATDVRLGRSVALKVIADRVATADGRTRFLEEARATASMRHPNIVTIYDVGEHEGAPYLVLEYIEGPSLRQAHLRQPLSLERIAEVGARVADALAHAHGRGFLHLDLKPANVIVPIDGPPRVLDFGLAQAISDAGEGQAAGTPRFMAPEQWIMAPLTTTTDVWALGVMLHWLVSGAYPFDAPDAFGCALQVLEASPPPLPDTVPRSLRQLIATCLAKRPEDRPPAAFCARRLREVADTLRGIAAVQTLAVLPFRVRAVQAPPLFGETLAEDLADALARIRGWRTLAAAATSRLSAEDPLRAGREVGASAIVSGSIRGMDPVRVKVRLLDVDSGEQLFDERFEFPLAELLRLEERVCQRIAETLRTEMACSLQTATQPVEAIDLYLRARERARADDHEGPTGALTLFERCLALAPRFEGALAGRALASMRSMIVPAANQGRDVEGDARRHLEEALERASSVPEVLVARAQLDVHDARYDDAVEALCTALRLAPTCAPAHEYLALLECEAGRAEDGVQRARLAAELDPSLVSCRLAEARYLAFAEDWEGAERVLAGLDERARTGRTTIFVSRIRFAGWRGDDDAISTVLERLGGETAAAMAVRLYGRAWLGELTPDEARRSVAAQSGGPRHLRMHVYYGQLHAEVCAARGMRDEARATLGQIVSHGLIDTTWLDRCPVLEPMRTEEGWGPMRETTRRRAERLWRVAPPRELLR